MQCRRLLSVTELQSMTWAEVMTAFLKTTQAKIIIIIIDMRLGYWHSYFTHDTANPTMRILQQRGFKWDLSKLDDSSNIKSSVNYTLQP